MATKKNKTEKNINYYLDLPWTYTISQEKDEESRKIFVVQVNELPGVATDAPTIEEALQLIKEALKLSFEMSLEVGDEIPEPITEKDFAGNISYRTTSQRHYLIAREARKRNMSLSQVIDTFIDSVVNKKQ